MANYIGREPLNGFFTKQVIGHDGSTTTFALTHAVATTTSIIVSVNAVILQPDIGYTLSGGGNNIIFASAPNATAYVHYLGESVTQSLIDLNGAEFILDIDNDSSMTADTDDQLDFKLGGSDVISFKTTGIHLPDGEKYVAGTGDDFQLYHDGTNSYVANSTGALRVATLTSGIAITLGHTTSEVTVADNLTVTGNLTVGGTTNFGDFNITNVGSIALDTITNDGTDITLDSSGDIILDAAGNDIFFKAGGTTIGEITNSSSDLVIKSSVSDKDILIKGNDGGSAVTALTLDMSDAGAATFNDKITVGDGKLVLNSTAVTSTAAELNLLDGVSGLVQADLTKLAAVDSTAAELNIVDGGTGASSVTIVDADQIILNDNGTMKQVAVSALNSYTSSSLAADDLSAGNAAVTLTTSSGNITIDTAAGDADIIFKGTDSSADITALTLDMSDAGTAVFNHDIKIADDGQIGSASAADAMIISSGGIVTFKDDILIKDGGTIGVASDADSITIASNGQLTLTQTLIGTALDISGDADIDGTLEADAITVDGVALAEVISDTTGAMFSSNTETGITATYQDADNTIDLALAAAQTTITSLLATDIKIGEDDQTKIDFETADTIHFYAGNQNQLKLVDGGLVPITDNDVDLGTASLEFKNVYVDGTVFADALGFGTTAITLPSADGSANQILETDGSGTLSFVDKPSSGISMGKAIAAAIVFG